MSQTTTRRTSASKKPIKSDIPPNPKPNTPRASVCFFNNKGGVGKTTLLANLAAELSFQYGYRILVVDADPQCNLSQYVLSDEQFKEIYYSANPSSETIFSVLHPISIGKGYLSALPITRAESFGFDVVLGDPRLALKEDLLAQDWRDAKSGGTRGIRTTFLFFDLIRKAEEYDLIFFDMGPSLGAINRCILLAADFFIVPTSIDIFSLWALRNIGEALSVWSRELQTGLKLVEDPREIAEISSKKSAIKFVGYVTQQHREKSEGGQPRKTIAYEEISKEIPGEIKKNLKNFYNKSNMQPHLGDIRNLGSLAPKAQTLHSPMTRVSVVGSYAKIRNQAREIYTGIAQKFIANIS